MAYKLPTFLTLQKIPDYRIPLSTLKMINKRTMKRWLLLMEYEYFSSGVLPDWLVRYSVRGTQKGFLELLTKAEDS